MPRSTDPPVTPPASTEGHDAAAHSALEAGTGQGGAAGCVANPVADCSPARGN